jgi:hypothetical protein
MALRPPAPDGDTRREDGGVQLSSREAWNGPPIIGQSALMQSDGSERSARR